MNQFKKVRLPFFITLLLFFAFKVAENVFQEDDIPSRKYAEASFLPFSVKTTTSESEIPSSSELLAPQRVHPVRITGDIFFAGEKVPLLDQEVRERFDRELMVNTFWHSNTMLNYKLANKYFDDVQEILLRNGIPADFKYLAIAESGLRNVVSPAGATGFWQFMKSTAESYDMEINSEVDMRYDYIASTEAACLYLKEAKEKFGSWTLAAASYNMGMAGVEKRLEEQGVDNYYDLFLNTETSRYVFRILAYKMVFENPEKFGFYIDKQDLYEPYDYKEVVVSESIPDLVKFAQVNGTTYKMLKTLNPWLRSTSLTISEGNSYSIKVPA